MLDCIIVGSGVGGISAALTLQANKKTFKIFGSKKLSEKIEKAEKIANYPGLSEITGADFCKALQDQLAKAEIDITEEKVSGVYSLSDKFGVATQEGGYYESKTVVLASGVDTIKSIDGEKEFLGKGVSYCATCDGFLYKDKTIAVVCTGKRLEHEISHLSKFAKKIYLFALYQGVEIVDEKVEILKKLPKKITGEKRVSTIEYGDTTLDIDGVFILRESSLPSTLIDGLEIEDGHIKVDRKMQTNIQGFYAVGDCTGRPYQYAKAVGEGNIAAHTVTAFLNENKGAGTK